MPADMSEKIIPKLPLINETVNKKIIMEITVQTIVLLLILYEEIKRIKSANPEGS